MLPKGAKIAAVTRSLLLTMILSACAYDASFEDCAVRCTTDMECPAGLTCEDEGFCRTPSATEATEACTAVLETFPSCVGLAETCGPNADEDCCSTATPIPGGSFYRSYDVASDGMYPSMSYPATVSPFVLDRFEVTVGRFRKFVEAGMGTRTSPPGAGAGAHIKIPGSGWDSSWNINLVVNADALVAAVKCEGKQTWTGAPEANEELPINCVTWYEAFAFCAWDGGFLPTEAEWNFAAAGGAEQRVYPWSNPANTMPIDCSYADYLDCVKPPRDLPIRVGSESPKGDGRWVQADLAGSLWEWSFDEYRPYTNPCDDCANLSASAYRVFRGGSSYNEPVALRGANRNSVEPARSIHTIGLRCARLP